MAILSSNVERSIAILIHTINFPTWWKAEKMDSMKHAWGGEKSQWWDVPTDQSDSKVIVTILDEDLRACEASVNGCHVQGALPFFALWKKTYKLIFNIEQRLEYNFTAVRDFGKLFVLTHSIVTHIIATLSHLMRVWENLHPCTSIQHFLQVHHHVFI